MVSMWAVCIGYQTVNRKTMRLNPKIKTVVRYFKTESEARHFDEIWGDGLFRKHLWTSINQYKQNLDHFLDR